MLDILRATAPDDVEVLEAYVDVHGPFVADVVEEARERTSDIVIVPLLLSTGYHTEVDLREARRLGLAVLPYTVNEPADMASLIELEVDGLITDYPDRLRRVMAEKGMALPPAFPLN